MPLTLDAKLQVQLDDFLDTCQTKLATAAVQRRQLKKAETLSGVWMFNSRAHSPEPKTPVTLNDYVAQLQKIAYHSDTCPKAMCTEAGRLLTQIRGTETVDCSDTEPDDPLPETSSPTPGG